MDHHPSPDPRKFCDPFLTAKGNPRAGLSDRAGDALDQYKHALQHHLRSLLY